MTIELSNITFTNQDDIVSIPQPSVEEIHNTGIANTLAGNDLIIGTSAYGAIFNWGVINTSADNDTLIGTSSGSTGISNYGAINTDAGNDTIIARGLFYGINNNGGTINSGAGDDIITATSSVIASGAGIYNGNKIIDTGDGGDKITGIFSGSASFDQPGIHNKGGIIDTGNDNDTITGIGFVGILNEGMINTNNGEDSLISQGYFTNEGVVFLGDGNDSLIYFSLLNYNAIETGSGNDVITGISIHNQGVINTGDGDDYIIDEGKVNGPNGLFGIYNNGGAINTGNGNDSIISNRGFDSGWDSSGAWFLGEGEDYIKGFGTGDFYGGNGNDTLELTPGMYLVRIWHTSVVFTAGSSRLMITSEFEKLIAGGTIYDFTTLTEGQTIIVS